MPFVDREYRQLSDFSLGLVWGLCLATRALPKEVSRFAFALLPGPMLDGRRGQNQFKEQ